MALGCTMPPPALEADAERGHLPAFSPALSHAQQPLVVLGRIPPSVSGTPNKGPVRATPPLPWDCSRRREAKAHHSNSSLGHMMTSRPHESETI